jgi:hypothetical protein
MATMVWAMIWAIALRSNSDRSFLRELKFRFEIRIFQFMIKINIQDQHSKVNVDDLDKKSSAKQSKRADDFYLKLPPRFS